MESADFKNKATEENYQKNVSTFNKARKQINTKASELSDKAINMGENLGRKISQSDVFNTIKEKAALYAESPEKINDDLTHAYNKITKQSGNQTIKSIWDKIETLFEMIRLSVKGEYDQLSQPKLILGIAVILYVIMPFDFLPDFLPVLGFADDAALLAWFAKKMVEEINDFEMWKKEGSVQQQEFPAGQ